MTARGVDDQTARIEMPTTSMGDPIPGNTMLNGSISKGGGDDKNAIRSGRLDLITGTIQAPLWEPGVVEVEFREGAVLNISLAALAYRSR